MTSQGVFGALQSWYQSIGIRSYMGAVGYGVHYGERIRMGKMVKFN